MDWLIVAESIEWHVGDALAKFVRALLDIRTECVGVHQCFRPRCCETGDVLTLQRTDEEKGIRVRIDLVRFDTVALGRCWFATRELGTNFCFRFDDTILLFVHPESRM